MLDFGDTLIMHGLEESIILLNIYVDLITLSMISGEIERLISSMKYEIPRTLRYNFD